MARLIIILLVGLVCEAIGVVFLSQGLKEIGNWLFFPNEIRDVSFLIGKLSNQADPISQFLWNVIPPDQQPVLLNPSTPSEQKRELLAEALNRAIENRSFYSPERFTDVALPGEVRKMIRQRPRPKEMGQLNRVLLEAVYPAALARQSDRPWNTRETLRLVGRGVTNAHILLGVFFEALFFVGLLMLMSKADVSFLWPLTSLSFVVTTIAAKIYLHEEVVGLRWAGVCLIMLGAALITWTEKIQESDADVPIQPPPAQAR